MTADPKLVEALAGIVRACLEERYIEHDEDVRWVAERLASAFQPIQSWQAAIREMPIREMPNLYEFTGKVSS